MSMGFDVPRNRHPSSGMENRRALWQRTRPRAYPRDAIAADRDVRVADLAGEGVPDIGAAYEEVRRREFLSDRDQSLAQRRIAGKHAYRGGSFTPVLLTSFGHAMTRLPFWTWARKLS